MVRIRTLRAGLGDATRRFVSGVRPSGWLGVAVVLGALFGLSTLLRPDAEATLGVVIGPAGDTYFETLLGIVITFVGFVIVAFVFIYEQQRRAWRIAFRIRDDHRAGIILGVTVSITLILVSIWAGLTSLIETRTGTFLSADVWPTAIAAAAGFSGVAGALITGVLVVQMLSSRRLAQRILNAPRRTSALDGSDDPLTPARHLMELALAEHRAEDDEEFRSRITTLKQYGCNTMDRLDAEDSIRALLDISLLVLGRRDRVVSAILAAQAVAQNPCLNADTERTKKDDATAKLLEKAVTLLERNLASEYPSASLTTDILNLGNNLHVDPHQQRPLFEVAIRRTVFRADPSDLWPAVCDQLTARLTDSKRDAGRSIPVGVLDLRHAMDVARHSGAASIGDSAGLAVNRVLPLLTDVESPTDAKTADVEALRALYQNLLLHLCASETDDPDPDDTTVRTLLRRLARLGSHSKNYDWLDDRIPQRYRTSIVALGEVTRALSDEQLRRSLSAYQRLPQAATSRIASFERLLGSDPDVAAEAIEFAFDSTLELAEKRCAATVLRILFWANEDLRGVVGLIGFILLRDAARSLQQSSRRQPSGVGAPKTDIGSLDEYVHLTRPGPGFFSPGLIDCAGRARALIGVTKNYLVQTNLHRFVAPHPEDSEAPQVVGADPDAVAPLAVVGQLTMLRGAALASHVDGEDGLKVFAIVASVTAMLPVAGARPVSATTATQMLLDGLSVATIALDVLDRQPADPLSTAQSAGSAQTDLSELLYIAKGLELLYRVCIPARTTGDRTTDDDNVADDDSGALEQAVADYAGALSELINLLTEPVGSYILRHLSNTAPNQRNLAPGVIPWSDCPDWVWRVVERSLRSSPGTSLNAYRLLTVVAALTTFSPTSQGLSPGLRDLVTVLVEHSGTPSFAEGKLRVLLADDLARRGDRDGAAGMLSAAKGPDHFDVALRKYFIGLANGRPTTRGSAYKYVKRLGNNENPRMLFGVVESAVHWMQSVDAELDHRTCLSRLQVAVPSEHGALITVGLAEQALRGEDPKGVDGAAKDQLERLMATTERQIAGLQDESPELILGLDPVSDTARSAALHIAMLAIMAELAPEDFDVTARQEHAAKAREQLDELDPIVRGRLTASLAAVEQRLIARV